MPYRRQAELLLAVWREVERELAATDPGLPRSESLQAEAAIIRSEYHELITESRAAGLLEPRRFPASRVAVSHASARRRAIDALTGLVAPSPVRAFPGPAERRHRATTFHRGRRTR